MQLMHFANNNPEKLTSAVEPFFIGLMQCLVSFVATFLNLVNLSRYKKVEKCVIHFIVLKVVVDVQDSLYKTMADTKLKKVFGEKYTRDKDQQKVAWVDRSCFSKFGRVIYKVYRALYVSVVFYFVSILILVLLYFSQYPYVYIKIPTARDKWKDVA